MSVDLRISNALDKQTRIVFDADGVALWEIFRQPGNDEFGVYNGSTGEIVLRFKPGGRPIVGGSWSDGSAAKSVLAALVHLRLVVDETVT